MIIVRRLKQMQGLALRIKHKGRSIGFVPTMGALHEGHLSLIRQARRENQKVVVSIFVNPIQFGPREDFKKYPRNFKHDAALCRKEGADIIFYPALKQMYPPDYKTYVNVEGLGNVLCGQSRPGHFRGVTTVVAKLFNIVLPDIAYFGQKDAQQAMIIRKMAQDLNMPLTVKIMPTLRDMDGLALSSRNIYLNKKEREDALVLFQSLNLAKGLIGRGIKDSGKITSLIRRSINQKENARIDYVAITDSENLKPVKRISGHCLIALAVWIGKTRLIDSIVI